MIMSKLSNAPLVEVVFELRWPIENRSDLSGFQYLHGDLYAELKSKYPVREQIAAPDIPLEALINRAVHRFRTEKYAYPLFQVGPGVLTLNTIDNNYYWEDFYDRSDELLDTFKNVNPFKEETKFSPSLLYFDFFPFDFDNNDVMDFMNKNFNLKIQQDFFNKGRQNGINLGFDFQCTAGDLSIQFSKGHNPDQQEGIVMQTRLHGKMINFSKTDLLKWLDDAHEICSDTFKQLTKNKIYKSFK